MKILVCVKVQETGGDEPIVETRIALTPPDACAALAELEGFELEEGGGYSDDPFAMAKEISQEDRNFYVEEHEVAMPATGLLKAPNNARPETCYCQPGRCMAPRPGWCIDSARRDAAATDPEMEKIVANLIEPMPSRDTQRFAQLSGGKSID